MIGDKFNFEMDGFENTAEIVDEGFKNKKRWMTIEVISSEECE